MTRTKTANGVKVQKKSKKTEKFAKIISLVGTKGGILKTTLIQCITTSNTLSKFKIIILDGDAQGSLTTWIKERDPKLKPLNIKVISHNKDVPLKEELKKYRKECDFLFVDLPGESKALSLTRTALAYSDLCIFPLRLSHKDTTAFNDNMKMPLLQVLKVRNKKHFRILPTFAHHSTNIENLKDNYASIRAIGLFDNVHKDRNIYTYFSVGGLTLREYKAKNRFNLVESAKASKAINDMEEISKELLKITK